MRKRFLDLSTGQSSETGSFGLLANTDIVYNQSQTEDRVSADDYSEQNGETACRADEVDDQNSTGSKISKSPMKIDGENFTEIDQGLSSMKIDDEQLVDN